RQCAQCNNWKSGNLTEYRSNLIKKIGLEEVERLEGSQKPRNYTIPELRELLERYKASNGQSNQHRRERAKSSPHPEEAS
ncbi:MAG: recombination protein NinG, partial [Acidimicrobiales bacterium]